MKKYLFITLLIMLIASPAFSEEVTELSEEPVSNVQDVIFRSSLTNIIPDVNDNEFSGYNDYAFDDYGSNKVGSGEIDPDQMPFFKQMRLMITGAIKSRGTKKTSNDKSSKNLKFWAKKKTPETQEQLDINPENEITNSIQSEIMSPDELPEDTISLEGEVNEQVTEKQLILDADNVNFDEETGDMIAEGRPVMDVPPQNMRLVADTMTYNEAANILKGIGNVFVLKDGLPIKGSYLEVDMNEETVIMDDALSETPRMNMAAKKAIQKDGLLVMHDGNFYSEESSVYRMMSRMIGPRFYNMMVNPDAQALFFGDPTGNNITIDIDNLYVNAKKNHDVITAKNIRIYRKDRKVFKWPRLTIYTSKDRKYFEANYPEFGTKRKVGMFVGPGFVFGGPAGSVVKVIPFLNYNHKFGFGGALKYINTYNRTELGYGSVNEIFFLKGIQRLDDNLYFQYGSNTYSNEWFIGPRMAKYLAEVYYDKTYLNKNFLAEGMDLRFRHRAGFGFMQDNDRNFYGERIKSKNLSTSRFRYMAELNQNFYTYRNEEKRIAFNVGVSMQGSAAVYGTGDTQFIARVGPRMHLQYKNWMQDIGYYLTGYNDQSPMPRYDMYRYGHQSVYLSEALRLNKYISVGWAGNINLSDDSPNGKMFQENAFIVSLGPDDLKISLGYDFVRQTTYFGFNVAFDTKGTHINYGKMEIKNPERLGKKQKKEQERNLAFSSVNKPQEDEQPVALKTEKKSGGKKVLQYAQVINIEDPDKETVQ